MSLSNANLKTPLLNWLAKFSLVKELAIKLPDARLDGSASSRVLVGVSDKTRQPYVVFTGNDDAVFSDMEISKIAFARQISERDWLVVITPDATGGRAKKPIPMRFWFPAAYGLFDGWAGAKDRIVSIGHIANSALPRLPNVSEDDVSIFGEAPLSLQGDWVGLGEIEDVPAEDVSHAAEAAPDDNSAASTPSHAVGISMEEDEEDIAAEIARMQEEADTNAASELDGLDIDALLKASL